MTAETSTPPPSSSGSGSGSGPTSRPLEAFTRPPDAELGRRLLQLMVLRVVLITFALGVTVALHVASQSELTGPNALWLFGVIGATYLLSLIYALLLRRRKVSRTFAVVQLAGDLVITTALVHVTGGGQSGYGFFYILTIIGAALVDYRRGALWAAVASVVLYTLVSGLGWLAILPIPAGQRLSPADLSPAELARQLALNAGAFAAVAVLAARLGAQLAATGASLASQEQKAADLAAQSADIIRCLSSGLVTVDRDGVVLTFNQAAEEITGLAAARVRGRRLVAELPALGALLEQLGGGGQVRRGEVRLPRRGVDRVLGVSVSALTSDGGAIGRIVNFQDLTDLRRMETQVKRSERLAAVGEMAAGVAHEIRNPLASISGSVELLRRAPQLEPDNAALMDIVVRECDRLNTLITELLDYARPREPMPATLDLRGLLAETVRVFAQDRAFGQVTVRLVVDESARGLELQADGDQLRQVVWNLLRNGAQAMADGGELTVELRRSDDGELPAGESQVTAGVIGRGPWAEFTITDGGVGMSAAERERLFEPFFTTKARGTGLGLATVYRIVTAHGGQLRVDTWPGKGTRIAVRLPLSGDPREGVPEPAVEVETQPIRPPTR